MITGNFIGTQIDGVSPVAGNTGAGLYIYDGANANFVGGTAAGSGNVIALNGQGGIRIDSNAGNSNAVFGNSIFSNTGLGIDLSLDGVTGNDNCDADAGPNRLQNFPVLTSAISGATDTTILGTLNSTASTTFRIEFFANAACSGSGNGEGKTFIGSTNVTTDAGCSANIQFHSSNATVTGPFITATATDPGNNTSEFSACVMATGNGGTLQFSASNYNIKPCSAAGALSAQCDEATVAAIEPSTATPSAPPTWREALTTPEAMPARAGSTEPIATPVVVGIAIESACAHEDERREDHGPVGGVDRETRQRREAERHHHHPAHHQRPRPDARGQLAGDRRDQHDHERHRQRAHAGLERRVAAHVLHVEVPGSR